MHKLATLILGVISLTNIGLALADTTPTSYINAQSFALSGNKAAGLKTNVLVTAIKAYDNALKKGIVDNKQYLSVIDYSMPSTEKRLWVIDLQNKNVVFNTLVAQGKNSGENQLVRFSNSPKSLETSIGVYVTQNTYSGKHGLSLVLDGLDRGFNDNAKSRSIVMHAASYVSSSVAASLGRIGRSWGCPAVPPEVSTPIINKIKDGSILVAYYPDPKWLQTSQYLA